jgi:hypothetical protein
MRLQHREYVGMIVCPGTAFTSLVYNINPGNSTLFPYLSSIARLFEYYCMHGW